MDDANVFDEVRALNYMNKGRDGRNRKTREGAGFSVRDLARPVRVSPSTITDWEHGTKPTGAAALRYALALLALDPEAPADLLAALTGP